jgi:hypothetical protein
VCVAAGAWVGGDWVSIEECAANFDKRLKSTSCDKSCKRSQSKVTAARPDGTYDG